MANWTCLKGSSLMDVISLQGSGMNSNDYWERGSIGASNWTQIKHLGWAALAKQAVEYDFEGNGAADYYFGLRRDLKLILL